MPVMNGLDCLKELKTADHLKHIPIIMYSTSERPDEVTKAMNLGAMEFWKKPYKYFDLLKKLKDLINSVFFS
jgi:CheY-like chemotaxis protein